MHTHYGKTIQHPRTRALIPERLATPGAGRAEQ